MLTDQELDLLRAQVAVPPEPDEIINQYAKRVVDNMQLKVDFIDGVIKERDRFRDALFVAYGYALARRDDSLIAYLQLTIKENPKPEVKGNG